MIVEFIGCSGAGKTTLARAVAAHLSAATEPKTSCASPLHMVGLQRLSGKTAGRIDNMMADVLGAPFLFARWPRHRRFMAYAKNILWQSTPNSIIAAAYLRSIARRVGMHELCRTIMPNHIVLADEGTLLTGHHLHVFSRREFRRCEVTEFLQLVPCPDLVVHVRAPLSDLLKRASERSDARWELRNANATDRTAFVRRAVDFFDTVAAADNLRQRVLVIPNPTNPSPATERAAETISQFILQQFPLASTPVSGCLRNRSKPTAPRVLPSENS